MSQTRLQQNLWHYTGKNYQPHADFWRAQLDQLEAPFRLEGAFLLEGAVQPDCACRNEKETYPFELDASTTQVIDAIAKQDLLAIYVVVVSALTYLCSRYTGLSTILIDSPGLAVQQSREAMGEIVSLLFQVNESVSLKTFISTVSQIVSQSYSYQSFPYREMIASAQTKENLVTNVVVWLPEIHGACPDLNPYDWAIEIHKDSALHLTWHYNPRYCDRTFVQGFAQQLQHLFSAYTQTDTPLAHLEILSPDEQSKLLGDWAVGERIERQPQTIHEMFAAQSLKTPHNIAIQTPSRTLTYQELDAQANQLAHYLRTQYHIQPDELIGVMLGRSEALIIGLLAILKAGGTYLPIDPDTFSDRLEFLIRDAAPKVLLIELDSLPQLQNLLDIPMFAMDIQLAQLEPITCPPASLSRPSDLAYIIYTSGSTGTPKGVMVEHQSFVNMAIAQIDAFDIQPSDRVLQFANPSFDASLSEIFMALFSGAAVVLVDKATLADRQQFLIYLDAQKVTVATFPPAYLRALEQPQFQYLRVMITAGEASYAQDAHHYAQQLNYFNAYGPTEISVCTTIYKLEAGQPERMEIPLGNPISNTAVYLLDHLLRLVPTGVVGEICVAGKGLARGYLHNPELTASKFVENPFAPGEKLYRTGDLSRRLANGELLFGGRDDRQVKIRGYRIELGEIEAALCRLSGVTQSVVVTRTAHDNNQEILAYVVGESELESPQLRAGLSQILPDYMLPATFVLLEEFPLTPNGKIDYRAIPIPEIALGRSEASYDPPTTPTQASLAALWAEVLGLEKVSIHDNFFEIGGHSLLATQLVSRIRDALAVEIPQGSLFETPTIAGLSTVVESLRQTGSELPTLAITPIHRTGPLPLSFAQQRLWFLDQLEGSSATYNIPAALHLQGTLNVTALEMAVQEIVRRHEVLRTCFHRLRGTPVQVITPHVNLSIPLIDLRSLPEAEQIEEVQRLASAEAQQPFDLTQVPLVRLTRLQLGVTSHVLLVTIHHIVSDGWSMGLFIREVAALYKAFAQGEPSPLPELTLQYADFAHWQRQWLGEAVLQTELDYWQHQLAGVSPLLKLPTDRPHLPIQTFQGRTESFTLPPSLSQRLQQLSHQSGVTLFMTLLAAFVTFLGRYSAQEDIVVGSPIANRQRAELEPLIGFFVNTLVLRNNLQGNPSFLDLLQRVKQLALAAYAHQNLPFEQLVEVLQPERSLSYSPLFQVMFVLQNAPMGQLELPGLTLTPVEMESGTAKFDLTLVMTETEQGLQGIWEYNRDLFDASTIRRMISQFQTLLEGIVAHPDQRLAELPLLSAAERHQLLREWNNTPVPYPQTQCLHQLFEAQVGRTSAATAVVFADQSLTYTQLNQRANQLAHYLQQRGVGLDGLVGICIERSLEMVVGLLGILKAGAAYVPLDPGYPADRLTFMLEDSQISVLLTSQALATRLPDLGIPVIYLDTDWEAISQSSEDNPVSQASGENLAYMIYTSGSTGQPKGAMNTHRGVCNRLLWMQDTYALTAADRVLQKTPFSFDVSVWELFLPLLTGACLVMAQPGGHQDPAYLIQLIVAQQITTLHFVPSMLRVFLEEPDVETCTSLKRVICSGEALSLNIQARFFPRFACELHNLYGPTEAAIDVTYWHCQPESQRQTVPIGRPIANTQIYILDPYGQPVPIGVAGELYIGGDGLARGYFRRPDITAEKFIPNPFSEQPGERLYKTGDLARYLPDGAIEFLGRLDYQVKIRGFRIELGEIEAGLAKHPAIAETVVLARKNHFDETHLVAYLVPDTEYQSSQIETGTEFYAEQVSQWQQVFNSTYGQTTSDADSTFNIIGWNNSYTGLPLLKAEMREWLDHTVTEILSRQPQRILEIGCGTGMLLLQIAPHCSKYVGTDISQEALNYVEQQMQKLDGGWFQVTLVQQAAHDFERFETEAFDAIILNSVVQYFPSIDYLLGVLEGAVKALLPGGFIWLGDVRSLPLLEAFHADLMLHQSPPELPIDEWWQRVQKNLNEEQELVIDPAFFTDLTLHLPRISRVDVQLKRGRYHNELTRFRYNVMLHVGSEDALSMEPQQLDWQQDQLTLPVVRQWLVEKQPESLLITGIPNARVQNQIRLLDLLAREQELVTVGDLQTALATMPQPEAIDPEDVWSLSDEFPYAISITGSKDQECYDVLFWQRSSALLPPEILSLPQQPGSLKPWQTYANNPLQEKLTRQLFSQLRSYLEQTLPDYMVPSAFVTLEALPLTPNGKLDRRALPDPDSTRPKLDKIFVAPRTTEEAELAKIWTQVLAIDRVGIHDNFFELGGHSLLATQVISQIRSIFAVEIPLFRLFEFPTIAELSQVITAERESGDQIKLPPITLAPRDQTLPLSWAQQRLWFLNQMEGDSATYNMPATVHLSGLLDVACVEKVIAEIVSRHEVLRTTLTVLDSSPIQVISPISNVALSIVDLQSLSGVEQSTQLQRLIAAETRCLFDLSSGPLLRVTLLQLGTESQVLLVVMHHIVSDGWSMGIFVQEFAALYAAFSEGNASPLTELPIQYADFAIWQRQHLSKAVLETQFAYWKEQLAGAPPLLELPTDRPRASIQTFRGGSEEFHLHANLTQKLKTLSQTSGATLFMTLLAAFAILLSRYSQQEDIVIGSPIANRNRSEIEPLIGFFVNTLVLRIGLDGNPSFTDLLQRVRQITLEAHAYQDVPFEQLVEELQPQRNLSHSPLFQVMFVLQNTPMGKLELPGLLLTPLETENTTAKFDLTLSIAETDSELIGSWEYNSDLFDVATITRMAGTFQTLLEKIVANPAQRVAELPLLNSAERHQLLVQWNNTQVKYPHTQCFHHLFENITESMRNRVAVMFADQHLTYQKLNDRANQLAHYLQSLGVGPEGLVALCMERSLEMMVGLLGILKAGGAYVPLDPQLPQERLAYMVSDAQVSIVLTQEKLRSLLLDTTPHLVCLDTDWEEISAYSQQNPVSCVQPANLAYVIYTSGSTGKPKGTAIAHQGLVNYLYWCSQAYEVGAGNGVPVNSSISFDATITSLFSPLLVGQQLVMLPEDESIEGLSTDLNANHHFTFVKVTPAHLNILSQLLPPQEARERTRLLIVGGEELSGEALSFWRIHAPDTRIINEYGPTETVVGCCVYEVTETTSQFGAVAIGRPIANTQLYILDASLQPVPIGVVGELYIGGVGLARGYLNRPDLTAEKFIPHPFSQEPGSRLYKTGDRARYRSDGTIEFLGRIDHQVKLRGFRIELGEIEAVLKQYPQIREAVVMLREDQPGDKRLVAYLVADTESIDTREVSRFLKAKLPNYMVPAAFVPLLALPLTPNGKCDRRALPIPEVSVNIATSFVPPSTATEKALASIWAEVLHLEQVGIHHNFFELGGHSLLATQLISCIRDAFSLDLPLRHLFESSTVAELAKVMEQLQVQDEKLQTPAIVPLSRETRRMKRSLLMNKGRQ
jgi:amino acid adenylation domain-containing protein